MKSLILIITMLSSAVSFSAENKPKTLSGAFDVMGVSALEEKNKKSVRDFEEMWMNFYISPSIQNNSYTYDTESAESKNMSIGFIFEAQFENLFARFEPAVSFGSLVDSSPVFFKDGESVRAHSVTLSVGLNREKLYYGFGITPYDRLAINQASAVYYTDSDPTLITVTQNLSYYGTGWNIFGGFRVTENIGARALYEKHSYKTSMAHFNNWSSSNIYFPTRLYRSTIAFYLDYKFKEFGL